jgi:prepilin-type N-terminal cleavage/methylation domain-containing protein
MLPRLRITVRPAFTLVEILVCLVILGIAAAVIAPRAIGMGDIQVRSAAAMLQSDLQYAQNEAVVTQQTVTITFSPSTGSYTLYLQDGTVMQHPVNKYPFTVSYAATEGVEKVGIESATFSGSASVTFDSLGAPDNPGSVVLAADTHRYRIDVGAVTGRVAVTALD